MCLIMGRILEVANIMDTLRSLALYSVTVLTGLAIHSLISLPLLYFVTTKQNPCDLINLTTFNSEYFYLVTFMRGLLQAWITALGTASRHFLSHPPTKTLSTPRIQFRHLADHIPLSGREIGRR